MYGATVRRPCPERGPATRCVGLSKAGMARCGRSSWKEGSRRRDCVRGCVVMRLSMSMSVVVDVEDDDDDGDEDGDGEGWCSTAAAAMPRRCWCCA